MFTALSRICMYVRHGKKYLCHEEFYAQLRYFNILFVLWYLLICGVEIGIMCSLIGFCTGLRFVFYQFAINGF